jgi:two-component system, OmpR family, phosphate regulon sensor histidine kinase PhoR
VKRRRLLWTLLPLSLLATAACLVAAGLVVRHVAWTVHVEETRRDLLTRARLVATQIEPALGADAATLDAAVKLWGRGSDARLTVVAADGRVLADSGADPAAMENHAGRPEIRQARALGEGWSTHRSATLGIPMLYVAFQLGPSGAAGRPVLRAALPLDRLEGSLAAPLRLLALAGAFVLVIVALLAWISARGVSRSLKTYEDAAARFADGDFARRLPVSPWRELSGLGLALNTMAAQLDQRMRTITRQASEQDAVLSSMSEGVLAIDAEHRVISLNDAAAEMLGVARESAAGRPLQEVVRQPRLEAILLGVLQTGEAAEAEIELSGHGDRHLEVHCTKLADGGSGAHGAVAVLNDLTRLKRLETVRRDFVANVSHELKTPVTSIQGFIETLREGALQDPARAERFLGIIGRQAERLSAIIDDLLTLSRLEQEGKEAEVPRRMARMRPVIESALQVCEPRAADRGTPLVVECDESLEAPLNPPLFEQALVNLVDNAIKHSESGDAIEIRAVREGADVAVSITDRGVGIEAQHLPRLFERFYRVDRARSRKEGGTGLGLAIVKHIARVHDGAVEVRSAPGEGSTFTLRIPAG